MNVQYFLRTLLGSLLLGLCLAAQAAQTFSFAVVPQVVPTKTFAEWAPVLKQVSKMTGIELKLKVYQSIPEFEADFLKGGPDIAYMNPYHFIMASKAAGYRPIIRDGANRLQGILVVRHDSPVTRLDQLDGATLAFPAPNAFGASLYMRALLTREAKIRFTPNYVTTHPNVFRNVILGQALAGGAVLRTFDQESPQTQAQLRILYRTPAVYPHPIAVHPRVPAKLSEAIQGAFLEVGRDPAFADLLKKIEIVSPAKASPEDYAPLEKLGLEDFAVLPKQ